MWTPLDWAEYHDYQVVILENVVDAHLWRPFPAWLQAWKSLGYDYELVYLNSMFAHPTPQSRDRMYFVAWKHGNRKPDLSIQPLGYCMKCEKDVASVQSWKNPQRKYGKYKQQYVYRCPVHAVEVTPYYYAAANAIDWSLPAPRIGDRKKPLRAKTLERIAYGLEKFAARQQPLLVHTSHGECGHASYVAPIQDTALPTQTTRQDLALVTPFLLNLNHPEVRPLALEAYPFPTQTAYDAAGMVIPPCIAELHETSKVRALAEALATVYAGGQRHGLIVPPFLMDHLGEYRPRDITGPFSTICAAGNHHSLIMPPSSSWLMTYYNNGQLVPTDEAVPTVTTLARHALVTSEKRPDACLPVEECGFRMLVPKEVQAAMAFPGNYILTGTRREQVKQLGNAVTPPVMKLLMERVIASLALSE